MEVKMVNLGLFNLPGIIIEDEINSETKQDMKAWASQNNCGKLLQEDKGIWSFRNEKQRNFFLMRWAGANK